MKDKILEHSDYAALYVAGRIDAEVFRMLIISRSEGRDDHPLINDAFPLLQVSRDKYKMGELSTINKTDRYLKKLFSEYSGTPRREKS